jgi:hypothetical protein
MSLFKKAKTVASTTTTKGSDKKASILVKDPTFFDKVQMLEKLNDNLKRDKAKADMISEEIKEISKDEWIKFYEAKGSNPGSVIIEAQEGDETASVMLIPSDKYITIKAARASELVDKYGEEIVEEKTTFSFDTLMVEKYGEDSVARIIAFGTMTPKACVRKVLNAFSVPQWEIKSINDTIDESKHSIIECEDTYNILKQKYPNQLKIIK